MKKPGQASQLLRPTRRPYPGNPLDGVGRPHKNWASAGGSGQTKHKDPRKGGCLEKGDTVYDGRFRLSQLSYLPSRNFGCGTQRSSVLEVLVLEVRCFQKYAPTILAARRRPFQLHPEAPDPQTLLPTTEHVEWTWRKEKAHAIGTRYPSCPLWEIPEIAANREMSTLSTRNRAVRLEQILDERTKLEWGEKLEEIARTKEGARRLRSQEIEQMREVVEAKKRLLAEGAKIRNTVKGALSEPTTKKASRGFGEALEGHRV